MTKHFISLLQIVGSMSRTWATVDVERVHLVLKSQQQQQKKHAYKLDCKPDLSKLTSGSLDS